MLYLNMEQIISFPRNCVAFVSEKGLLHSTYFAAFFLYSKICRCLRKSRFDLYDFSVDGQPEKYGFFIPEKEKKLEFPREEISFEKVADEAFIFGTNSKFECIALRVKRISSSQVTCSLVLRHQDGRIFTLPKSHWWQKSTSDGYTFGSSRLKIQCLIPMRKWRIFFNGVLREHSKQTAQSEKHPEYKHVKFSMLWVPSSNAFDFSEDLSDLLLSHNVASSMSWNLIPSIIKNLFNKYEQGGMLFGTLQIEEEQEAEIYLWGARSRSEEIKDYQFLKIATIIDIYGNFEDGSLIHISLLRCFQKIKKFACGYIMWSNGFMFPMDRLDFDSANLKMPILEFTCYAGNKEFKITVNCPVGEEINFRNEDCHSFVTTARLQMNGEKGKGFLFDRRTCDTRFELPFTDYTNQQKGNESEEQAEAVKPLTAPLYAEECKLSNVSGGKGSSLSFLFAISQNKKEKLEYYQFEVPNGIVVTVAAYQKFITECRLKENLETFEKQVWNERNREKKQQLCESIIKKIKQSELPEDIKLSISTNLNCMFGSSFLEKKFAVRSSATGEDTENISAAGQMETFLGVSDLNEIFRSVVNCWASQFTFQAIEYKRQHGQILNMPMAVVIQEMVPCDIAGVMFTCDPVTGNPKYISITANWGLGESVVSASAEPDTVTIKRSVSDEVRLHSTLIGKKGSKIVTDDCQGTIEVPVDAGVSSECCLSEEDAIKLGEIAVEVEKLYGSPRDVEWGIYEGRIYLFQSRPVTSLDVETDFEIEHAIDSGLRCEKEILSRAHVGEALQGATSALGINVMCQLTNLANERRLVRFDGENYPNKPYFVKGFVISHFTAFFDLMGGLYSRDDGNEFLKAMIVSFFGRLIDDKKIREMAKKRHFMKPKRPLPPFLFLLNLSFGLFFGGISFRRIMKKKLNFSIPYEGSQSADETLKIIGSNFHQLVEILNGHVTTSFSSAMWNSLLLTTLAKSEGDWNNTVYSDFAYLLSTCSQVESANVPASIQELAYVISNNIDPDTFKKMRVEDALNWLEVSENEAATKYKYFLKRHGHRSVREADIFSLVFEENQGHLVQILQDMVNKDVANSVEKEVDSFSTVLSNVKVKLNALEKLKLWFGLINARRGVREREVSKSFMVRSVHWMRKAFRFMAVQMVSEGRILKEEHMFFLQLHELQELCSTRSPNLVSKAARRYKSYEKMNNLMFEEITSGIPKPINTNEEIPTATGFRMTGVPVSRGVVKARACVVKTIKEAVNIQQGDILITYSTDTAWSPYFPLLSGIVTELGGLISHGAVVAREYGLPCVVALHGATRTFKSGEMVLLDGNVGFLQRLD